MSANSLLASGSQLTFFSGNIMSIVCVYVHIQYVCMQSTVRVTRVLRDGSVAELIYLMTEPLLSPEPWLFSLPDENRDRVEEK